MTLRVESLSDEFPVPPLTLSFLRTGTEEGTADLLRLPKVGGAGGEGDDGIVDDPDMLYDSEVVIAGFEVRVDGIVCWFVLLRLTVGLKVDSLDTPVAASACPFPIPPTFTSSTYNPVVGISVVILLRLPGLKLFPESAKAAIISLRIFNLSCSVCWGGTRLSLRSDTLRVTGDLLERELFGRNPRVIDGSIQSTLRGWEERSCSREKEIGELDREGGRLEDTDT